MSAGYAVITVQTAWLKLYYPIDFLMATLNSVIDKQNKLMFYIAEAKNMGIEILGADVNKSEIYYTIEGNSIRTGLKALRNVGKMSIPIIKEREKNGEFKTLESFINRLLSSMDKRVLESLIYSGALDCFDGSRNSKINSVPDILEFIKNVKKGIFDEFDFSLPIVDEVYLHLKKIVFEELDEYDFEYLLDREYKYTGMYISGHPLDNYIQMLELQGCLKVNDVLPETDENDFEVVETTNQYDGQKIAVGGIIRDLKKVVTKKGDNMFLCSVEDITGSMRCVIFPQVTMSCLPYIEEGNLVVFEGTFESNERGSQLIVFNIKELKDYKIDSTKKLYINCPMGISKKLENFLFDENNKGSTEVIIQCNKKLIKCKQKIDLNWKNCSYLKNNYQILIK